MNKLSEALTKIRQYEKASGLIVTTVGALIATIQGSSLILALPDLLIELESTLVAVLWVLISYLLTTTVLVPVIGKLADRSGKRKLAFNFGLLVFTIFSLINGVAPVAKYHAWDMVIYRVGQGIGAALMFANSTPIITDLFIGPNLAMYIGVNQIALASGFVLGPVVGGLLTKISWRWVYYINVPIGGVGCIIGFIAMVDRPKAPVQGTTSEGDKSNGSLSLWERAKHYLLHEFDWVGTFLYAASLTIILVVICEAAFPTISNAGLIAMGVVAFVVLLVFIAYEMWVPAPLIQFRLLARRSILLPLLGGTFTAFARTLVTFSTLFYLQGPYGQDPFKAGISQLPFGIGLLIMSFVSGALVKKLGAWGFCVIGEPIMMAGALGFVNIKASTPLVVFGVYLALVGVGAGLFNSPNTASLMMSVKPNERGLVGSLNVMLSQFMSMVCITIVFKMILGGLPADVLFELFLYGAANLDVKYVNIFIENFHNAMWIAFAMNLVAFLLTFLYENAPYMKTKLPEVQEEDLKDVENTISDVDSSVNNPIV